MEQIFRVILSLSISGGLVGLLILLFRPMTRRLFAKRWTYYLWLLLLVRLLVPVHADINLMGHLSMMLSKTDSRQVSMEETEAGHVVNVETKTGNVSGMESVGNADETFDAAVIENAGRNETAIGMSVDRQRADQRAVFFQIAGIIWILGVFLTAVYRVCTYKSFVKGINAGCISVSDQRILNKAAEIQTRLGIMRVMPLYENASVKIPMLIGLRKPYIVLPSKLLGEMDGRENDIRLILHHELIHYKRRDIWYKWLFQAVLCVHWFNPLLYLFNRIFNVDCELSCDEAVMALLSEEGRRIYGNVLLDVAERNLSGETFTMHRNVPAMTLLEEKCTLKERLQGIAGYQKKGFIIGFCSALALVAFIALAVVCGVAGVHTDSGDVFVMRNESPGIVNRVLKSISDIPDISFGGSALVNNSGNPYRMYDDDALIAGESEHDIWLASNYCGGGNSVDVGKFELNGSDEVWIVHANKETTLEISSTFDLRDGRFKFVWVKPDQTVQTLNESGGKNTVKITLAQGRNVIKMVGQKARVKDVSISYGGMIEEDVDAIYRDVKEEYANQVLEGKQSIDVSRLEEICPYLESEEVSKLVLKACEESAAEEFDGKILTQLSPWISSENLTDIVLALGKDALSFNDLRDNIFPYLGDEQILQCVFHYIDLGNVLTDSQLRDVQPFISEEDFYRLIEYNGKKK